MNFPRQILTCFALSLAIGSHATAQMVPVPEVSEPDTVVLVADHVFVTGDEILTAQGNVEAFAQGSRVLANEIIYDSKSDIVTLKGPIRMYTSDGVVVLANEAELDTDFRNGLLRSARMMLNQQVQMAAQQLDRVDGRYNVLTKTTVSSCRVCDTDEPPLWRIRARRVIHDELERQVYFDHASLLVLDVPVLYFPQLRLPDPTLERGTGFLIPTVRTTSQLSYGLKMPYFIEMGPHRDLTLTPYLSSKTRTLEFRYRQAFKKGNITLNGAVSDDDIRNGEIRSYLFAEGEFDLKNNYKLSFNLKAVSDASYLTDYDYSDDDRLNSDITVRRSRRDENTRFAFLHFESLRDDEDNKELPTLVAIAETERRYYPTSIGGELRTNLEVHAHYRESGEDVVGRDVARTNASALWRRNWTLNNGLRTGITGELAFDAYSTNDDSTVSSFDSQFTPTVAVDVRYPMSKRGEDGATYVIEPIGQIGWTGGSNLDVANDESTRVEFDEGNLLSLSRFPSHDRRERGVTGALGFNWSRISEDGWQGNFTVGQVYHQDSQPDFTDSSGLNGHASDLLLAGQYKTQNGLAVSARGLFDPTGGTNKAAARLGWTNDKLWLDASYIWLRADPTEDRDETLAEWALDGSYRLSRHWTGLFDWRFDAGNSQTAEAGAGLEYRNECVKVELSISRRFSTSTTVQPSTSFGLSVALLGFSVKSNEKSYARTCG